MNDIISGHSFSFDSGVATHCGVNAALVYAHICFWIKENSQKEDCWHEGKSWMFQSQEQIAKHFEFMSRDQVKRSINILIEKGLLIKGNFNHSTWNQLTWYSVPDEIFKKIVTIGQNRPMHWANSPNGKGAGAQCIYSNTIKKEYKERNVGDVEVVDNQEPPEITPSKTKNVQNHRTKFSGRPIPEFIRKMKIPENDKQMLVNQFSDNELCLALEDAKSFHNNKEKIKNLPAFLTQRCKQYKKKRDLNTG